MCDETIEATKTISKEIISTKIVVTKTILKKLRNNY